MKRVFNFSSGPGVLPLSVLEKAGNDITDFNNTGQSVMEMTHRGADFKGIVEKAERLMRELLGIPEDYAVLFLQGGASLQFSMVPVNLAGAEDGAARKNACYVDTGVWADKAAEEAKKFVNVRIGASSRDRNYTYIPALPSGAPAADDAYLHLCLNNTIVGTKWKTLPDAGKVTLVGDASSCILSESLDVSRFGLIYAGAQKNVGPAGCTIVIIRKDLAGRAPAHTPAMLRYDNHIKEESLYNTPPCWCIYIISLVLEWLCNSGGLPAMEKLNRKKAAVLYDAIDGSEIFHSPVEKDFRSLMNVPFVVRPEYAANKDKIEKKFLADAGKAGLVNLAGHRLVGGLRASIYNAMPLEGVEALAAFIKNFSFAG